MMASEELTKAYQSGVLDPDRHQRLIEGSSKYCSLAGIPERFLLSGMVSAGCNPKEIDLVKQIPQFINNGVGGIYYVGDFDPPVEDRFMAIVGACMRNFIDARFLTIYQVNTHLEKRDMPDPTVLVIPNFYMKKGDGGELAPWQSGALHGMLLKRLASKKLTILYTQDLAALAKDYGVSMLEHLKNHYAKYSEQ